MITKTDLKRAKQLLKTDPKKDPEKYLDLLSDLVMGRRKKNKLKKEIDEWYKKEVIEAPELD